MSDEPTGQLRRRAATIAGMAAFVLGIGVPLLFGWLRPGYSHVSQYISELGEIGAPNAAWVNWTGFLPTGMFVMLFLWLIRNVVPVSRRTLMLLSAVGWAYLVCAFFPCDEGCPPFGSPSQIIHTLTAVIGYPAAIAGLIRARKELRKHSQWRRVALLAGAAAAALTSGYVLMLAPDLNPWRGIAQRATELAYFGWVFAVSVKLWRAK